MSVIRPGGWISIQDYNEGLSERARETELRPGIDYTVFFKLEPNSDNYQAYRQQAKIDTVSLVPIQEPTVEKTTFDPPKAEARQIPPNLTIPLKQLAVVEFTLLVPDPADNSKTRGTVEDGFLREAERFSVADIYAEEAYFSFDTTAMFDELDRLCEVAQLAFSGSIDPFIKPSV